MYPLYERSEELDAQEILRQDMRERMYRIRGISRYLFATVTYKSSLDFEVASSLNGNNGEATNSDDVEDGVPMCTRKKDARCLTHSHKTKFKKPASSGAARRVQEKVKLCKVSDLELCTIKDCLELYPNLDHWHVPKGITKHKADPKTPPGLNLPYQGKMTKEIAEKLQDFVEDNDKALDELEEQLSSKIDWGDEEFDNIMREAKEWINRCDDNNRVVSQETPSDNVAELGTTLNDVPKKLECVNPNEAIEVETTALNNVPINVERAAVDTEMSDEEYLELLRFFEGVEEEEGKNDEECKSEGYGDGRCEISCIKRDEVDDECPDSPIHSECSTFSSLSDEPPDPGGGDPGTVVLYDPWYNDLEEVVIYTTYKGLKPKGFNERMNYWLNNIIFGTGKNVLQDHATTKTVVAGTKRKGLLTYLFGHYDHYSVKKVVNNTENFSSQYRAKIKRSYLDYLLKNWKVTLLSVSGTSIEYQPAAILVALRTEFGNEMDDLYKMEIVVNTINYYVAQMKLYESSLFCTAGYNTKVAGKNGSDLLTLIDQARNTK